MRKRARREREGQTETHTETEKSERPLAWQTNEMRCKYFQRFRSVPITRGTITPQRNCSQSATCLGFAGFHVFLSVFGPMPSRQYIDSTSPRSAMPSSTSDTNIIEILLVTILFVLRSNTGTSKTYSSGQGLFFEFVFGFVF